jgi:hypothetical protein
MPSQSDLCQQPEPEERGKCRSCGVPIVWEVSAKGHKMPMNPDPVDGKRISHFATCPQANTWRKKKAPQ